ncbi:MAG: UDP-N-acetylmuramoyl-tripeptide--D-alanyl-D-alanine ligase [Parachlamydiaceae bacterium]
MKTIQTIKQLAYLSDLPCAFDGPIRAFKTDAREIAPGDVFIAIKGQRVDGHQFVQEAFFKGAACAIVDHSFSGESGPLLRSTQPLQSIQTAAARLLQLRKTKVIGITGSVGKTSTKEFLTTLLEKTFIVGRTYGNQNSQLGLPLTILNHTHGLEDYLVLEMGMTEPGQIAQLTQIAPPTLAMITQIALVHAENFSSLEEIAEAKMEIFSHSMTQLKVCPFEWKEDGYCHFSLVEPRADYYLEGSSLYERGLFLGSLNLPKIGMHYHHNLLGAISLARHLGLSFREINEQIACLKLPKQRSEVKIKQGVMFVDDSYNASAISVKAALNSLPEPIRGKGIKVAVLGSMLELGKFSSACHIDVAKEALKTVDYLFCFGEECAPMVDIWREQQRPAYLFGHLSELTNALKGLVKEGDIVLVKGSYGKEMWKVIEEF